MFIRFLIIIEYPRGMHVSGFSAIVRQRIKGKNLVNLFWLEVEAWIIQLIGWFPGNIGFLVRTIVYKFIFKDLNGFSFVQTNVKFVNTRKISIGCNFAVNSGSYINGIGEISIGNNVLVGPNVVISSGEHPSKLSALPIVFYEPSPKKITIGDGVWLGANVVILPGIQIGPGSIVGANAVLTENVGPNEIWGGIPARKLRSR